MKILSSSLKPSIFFLQVSTKGDLAVYIDHGLVKLQECHKFGPYDMHYILSILKVYDSIWKEFVVSRIVFFTVSNPFK